MYCMSYVIRQGDTLYTISRHFNIPVDAIIVANPFVNIYNLQVGEVICIPSAIPQNNYTDFTTYTVEEGDTLGSVLSKNGANLADLMKLNQVGEIFLLPGSTLKIPNFEGNEEETM